MPGQETEMLSNELLSLANDLPTNDLHNNHGNQIRFWYCVHEAGHFIIARDLGLKVDYVIANYRGGVTGDRVETRAQSVARVAAAGLGGERLLKSEFEDPKRAKFYQFLPLTHLLTALDNLHGSRISSDRELFAKCVSVADLVGAFIFEADQAGRIIALKYPRQFGRTICELYRNQYIGIRIGDLIFQNLTTTSDALRRDFENIPEAIRRNYNLSLSH